MRSAFALFGLLLALSACESTTGPLANNREGLAPPPGTERITEAVDGLVVGHRLMAAGEYDLALAAYTRAVTKYGLNTDVLSAIGSANMRLGRLGQAQQWLQKAVKKDPAFVPAWNNLGVVQINSQQFYKARSSFQRAFALDNGDSDDIRQNLILAIRLSKAASAEIPEKFNFLLVRRGNGRYLLLGQ
ncbi:MAG: tetratricopeptide repeat protein [Rhodobacteraceae bacterium]|nr:tetratricopeptide repeat protein [Paracoccaceae bacterium]